VKKLLIYYDDKGDPIWGNSNYDPNIDLLRGYEPPSVKEKRKCPGDKEAERVPCSGKATIALNSRHNSQPSRGKGGKMKALMDALVGGRH